VSSPVDRACGVRDRTHPYLLERGLEPAVVASGTGALGQRRVEPVGQRASYALEQQGSAAPEQTWPARPAGWRITRLRRLRTLSATVICIRSTCSPTAPG
jgi:hypothetical protein